MPMIHRFPLCALLLSLTLPAAAATFDADHPAALLTFPYVRVDGAAGLDTRIRLGNTGNEAVDVACVRENTTARCAVASEQTCRTTADCPPDDVCQPRLAVDRFRLRLAANQTVSWLVSSGGALPLPENGAALPPVPEDPFLGTLRCFAVDAAGAPAAHNVLVGVALVEEASPTTLDVASYNAVGATAFAAALDDNGRLTLGGPAPEYDACPAALRFNHLSDGARDPIAGAYTVGTTLALARCGADLSRDVPAAEQVEGFVVQFLVHNEFAQRFSTSRPFTTDAVQRISTIDTTIPDRSIFSAAVVGTLSSATKLQSVGTGVMGIGLESRFAADGALVSTAAFNLHGEGERSEAEALALRLGCTPQPIAGCRAAAFNRLVLSDRGLPRLAWEWRRGTAAVADLGEPLDSTAVAICVYAGGGAPLAELVVPPADGWETTRVGLHYRDRAGAADGVRAVAFQAGATARARIAARAAGAEMAPLDLDEAVALPVVVQLVNSRTGVCFESTFDSGDAVRSRPGAFYGRSSTAP